MTERFREDDLHIFIAPKEDHLPNPAAGPWVKVETDMIARAVIGQRYRYGRAMPACKITETYLGNQSPGLSSFCAV